MPARKKKSAPKPKRAPKRKTSAKKAASAGPKAVRTGKGPAPLEVALQFTELLRSGNSAEVEERWLASGIESVEGHGASMSWKGKKNVLAKYRDWEAQNEFVDSTIEGPWVGATGFAVRFVGQVLDKATGERHPMEEIAVYTVRDGKVVREEFHFAVPA
jgi:SnoaL-like protein